jgi:AraC-like DNA-binding protein
VGRIVAVPKALPLARHLLVQTSDLDEARERVARVFCEHKLAYSQSNHNLNMRQHVVRFGNLALSYITYRCDVSIDPGKLSTFFLVHFIPKGGCQIRIGGDDLVGSANAGSVTSPTLPMRMRWDAECAHLVLKIDGAALERHLSHLLGEVATRPIEFKPGLEVQFGLGAGLRRLVDFVAGELDRDDSLLASPLGVTSIEQALMNGLLAAQPSNYTAALANRAHRAAPRQVIRAEELIRAHPEQPITIGDLTLASGVSARALYEGFRRFRATTPMAMLRTVRLEHVRADLQSAGPDAKIIDIAYKWGIAHLGRFAADYRARFGELPSENTPPRAIVRVFIFVRSTPARPAKAQGETNVS